MPRAGGSPRPCFPPPPCSSPNDAERWGGRGAARAARRRGEEAVAGANGGVRQRWRRRRVEHGPVPHSRSRRAASPAFAPPRGGGGGGGGDDRAPGAAGGLADAVEGLEISGGAGERRLDKYDIPVEVSLRCPHWRPPLPPSSSSSSPPVYQRRWPPLLSIPSLHGVKQRLNCWADGVPMITQCPILPNHNLTCRFDVAGQEGTLWWHAHVPFLRASLHGALIIRPRHGARSSYPFPKPHEEIPIILGEWWEMDLEQLDRNMIDGYFDDNPTAMTINAKIGDPFNCSGAIKGGYVLDAEPGNTYLLRVINAALFSEVYLKIAGHKFTVVAADANYVNPYTMDVVSIAPGETMDVLVAADAPPGRYYMVALAQQPPEPDQQIPFFVTSGTVQ
ncbi:Laccase-15 [Dichanthelium oligosanthes]|uniref:laccase n=1 Tax=Dichanthelium oligosanthes TaxID=888268 RepID=A0A1E5VRG1_9POAL|nr:Laccase-15 [Dichanthelium oligosanthes]